MKNWTCSILSVVLLTASAFGSHVQTPFNGIFEKTTAFFMGLEKSNESNVVIDLVGETLTDKMLIEIDDLNAQITTWQQEKVPEQVRPSVLIYHTHTDEAYLKGENDYVETSTGRTKDQEYSVVKVGEVFKNKLEEFNFTVIHDKTDNVSPGFNKAYETSYNTIKKYVGSVDIYVDMHRDAYSGQKTNYVEYNNTQYANICFVVAKGENYVEKPNWQENYKVAQALTQKLNELCPGICKDIIFKNTRFNQHVSNACLLIEMGNENNTLEQVNNSAVLVAEAFDRIF